MDAVLERLKRVSRVSGSWKARWRNSCSLARRSAIVVSRSRLSWRLLEQRHELAEHDEDEHGDGGEHDDGIVTLVEDQLLRPDQARGDRERIGKDDLSDEQGAAASLASWRAAVAAVRTGLRR